jgi:rhodanese-related sulfurtransferase
VANAILMSSITPDELAALLRSTEPPALLDVRESDENAFCAIAGSRLMPISELGERFAELEDWKDRDVVVYCHHGVRSAHAIAFLRGQGFRRLTNLVGGIDRWSLEVDPAMPRY